MLVIHKIKKVCKYCKSNIDNEAVVCPKCRRDQRIGNNPLWLIPIVILIVIGIYFFLSPSAPLRFRKGICGLGLRHGYPYCYYYILEEE